MATIARLRATKPPTAGERMRQVQLGDNFASHAAICTAAGVWRLPIHRDRRGQVPHTLRHCSRQSRLLLGPQPRAVKWATARTANRGSPTAVSRGPQVQAIGTGSSFTCGLAVSGTAYCWGAIAGGGRRRSQSYPGARRSLRRSLLGGSRTRVPSMPTGLRTAGGTTRPRNWATARRSVASQPTPVAGAVTLRL